MQTFLVKRFLNWAMARLRAGDLRPVAWLDAEDIVFTFPGENSWGGVFHGKAAHREWLERFVRCGFQIWPDQVAVSGPPWRTRLAIQGHDQLSSPEGEVIYENRYVLWATLRWFRTIELEGYEDTEKSAALDVWLSENEHRLVPAA